MYIVTGAAGFIGSNVVRGLNARGIDDIVVVDDLTQGDKFVNLCGCQISHYLDKKEFRQLINTGMMDSAEAVFHLGACSDTTERNGQYMMDNNYQYTVDVYQYCQAVGARLIYASSAAVYGAGPEYVEDFANERPLNVYGYSKYLFDQYLRREMQSGLTSQVVGLRYFNVYGPHEQHKGFMSSVAYHHYQQFKERGYVELFGAYDGWEAGAQSRDFIHVDDVVAVNLHFLDHSEVSGIFNCGTGRAQPFNDIAQTVVNTLQGTDASLFDLVDDGRVRYIDFPDRLKGRYQSFTQANIEALRGTGFHADMLDVARGVQRYVAYLESQ